MDAVRFEWQAFGPRSTVLAKRGVRSLDNCPYKHETDGLNVKSTISTRVRMLPRLINLALTVSCNCRPCKDYLVPRTVVS